MKGGINGVSPDKQSIDMLIIIWILIVIGITIHSIVWLVKDYKWQKSQSVVSDRYEPPVPGSAENPCIRNMNTVIPSGINVKPARLAGVDNPAKKPKPFLEPRVAGAIERIIGIALRKNEETV